MRRPVVARAPAEQNPSQAPEEAPLLWDPQACCPQASLPDLQLWVPRTRPTPSAKGEPIRVGPRLRPSEEDARQQLARPVIHSP
jgi:hypothetical protein